MKFTWNEKKRLQVEKSHKVDFERLKDIFNDPFAIEFVDENHSTDEEIRFGIIGFTVEYGLIYLVFFEVSINFIRCITARKAEKWMVKRYEQEKSRI